MQTREEIMRQKRFFVLVCVATLLATGTAFALDNVFTQTNQGAVNLFASPVTLLTGMQTSSEYVVYAKVTIENNSTGVRSVQCLISDTNFVDRSNMTLGPGEAVTLPLILAKSGSSTTSPTFSCFIFSTGTSNVRAVQSSLAQHIASVLP
jgi:hypothetical protein